MASKQIIEWRAVSDHYEVSTLGDVRSLDKYVNGPHGNKALKKGKLLSKGRGGNGYLHVSIDGVSKSIHRLVACAFIKGDTSLTVNHIDGDKKNNNVNNLEWCTHKEQNSHMVELRLNAKRTETKAIDMLVNDKVVKTFPSMRKAADYINGSHQAISRCCNNKSKTHKGYTFKFK